MFDVEIQEGAPRMKLPYNLTGMQYDEQLTVLISTVDLLLIVAFLTL